MGNAIRTGTKAQDARTSRDCCVWVKPNQNNKVKLAMLNLEKQNLKNNLINMYVNI